jgi:hypothetical protein
MDHIRMPACPEQHSMRPPDTNASRLVVRPNTKCLEHPHQPFCLECRKAHNIGSPCNCSLTPSCGQDFCICQHTVSQQVSSPLEMFVTQH